jgi:hypothetical protein
VAEVAGVRLGGAAVGGAAGDGGVLGEGVEVVGELTDGCADEDCTGAAALEEAVVDEGAGAAWSVAAQPAIRPALSRATSQYPPARGLQPGGWLPFL